MARFVTLVACLLLAACGDYPRDASGTTERIENTRTMRVGVVSGGDDMRTALSAVEVFAARHGAILERYDGATEALLGDLEDGKLDIVVGPFGRASPLVEMASLSDAVGIPEPKDGKTPVIRLARKHGENRLILETDKMVAQ